MFGSRQLSPRPASRLRDHRGRCGAMLGREPKRPLRSRLRLMSHVRCRRNSLYVVPHCSPARPPTYLIFASYTHIALSRPRPAQRMPRYSGLQRDVLSLYRQCLRVARKKPTETRKHFEQFARSVNTSSWNFIRILGALSKRGKEQEEAC